MSKPLYYAFHKDMSDYEKLIPKEYKNKVLECTVLTENNHHWVLQHGTLKFTVVKYPRKQRDKTIPPFTKYDKAEEYLKYALPTFDKDGERL